MILKKILHLYLVMGLLTIPVTLFIIYTFITELLDLILNTKKFKKLLEISDAVDLERLEEFCSDSRNRQSKIKQTYLLELERQIKYKRLINSKMDFHESLKSLDNFEIKEAKEATDYFKLN